MMISYAQNYEDVMLARVFEGRKDGFYVDVGAGDPVRFSVTKWFYDQGWTGLNIEPNAALFQRLVDGRPRDVNLDCGVGACAGEATLLETPVPELSTFDHRLATGSQYEYEARKVQILTLTEILDRYAWNRPIDFLKIDVEGWELQVLTGLDLQRYRPAVIAIEATTPQTRIECAADWEPLLDKAGYSSAYFDGLNKFYIANERAELKRHFALPPNIFDGFKTEHLVRIESCLAETQTKLAQTQALLDEARSSLTQKVLRVGKAALNHFFSRDRPNVGGFLFRK